MTRFIVTFPDGMPETILGDRFEMPSNGKLEIYDAARNVIASFAAGQWRGIRVAGEADKEATTTARG